MTRQVSVGRIVVVLFVCSGGFMLGVLVITVLGLLGK